MGGTGKKHHNLFILLSIILFILFFILFGAAVIYKTHSSEIKQSVVNRAESQRKIEEQKHMELYDSLVREFNDSFYQKLADGFDVDILIIGDSIGVSGNPLKPASNWPDLLKDKLEKTYGVKVHVTNISMGGNTSYAGYVRTMMLDTGIDYDLAIICYGQNDELEYLDIYYEAIIRAVNRKYPHASIISVLESSLRDYTEKIKTIEAVAEHYGIPMADTIAPFQEKYDLLVLDGVHPNSEGNKIYTNVICKLIDDNVAGYKGADPTVEVIDERVVTFDMFRQVPAESFSRTGNTFTLDIAISGTVLGIDYIFVTGENTCKILVDGIEFAAPEQNFEYDASQRHIMTINDWMNGETINAESEITVIFEAGISGKAQADGFNGLFISGGAE